MNNSCEICPALLGYSLDAIQRQMENMSFAPTLHLDVVVPPLAQPPTPYQPTDFLIWDKTALELHLMAQDVVQEVAKWQVVPAIKTFIIHIETGILPESLAQIKTNHKFILALNAETPVSKIEPFLAIIDGVQLMGVKLGRAGQNRVPNMVEKVNRAHELWPQLPICFDGGLKADKTDLISFKKAGVTHFCVGNALLTASEPKELYEEMMFWLNEE